MRTLDTDVLVLAVAFLQQVTEGEHLDLWVAFSTGNNFRYIAGHDIATKLGREVSKALPVFHAFTGRDTVENSARSMEILPGRYRRIPGIKP